MLLTVQEVADLLRISPSMIYKMVAQGKFPAPIKLNTSVRWDRAEIEAWIAEQKSKRTMGSRVGLQQVAA